MALSTEETVTQVIVDAINGIGADLGFDSATDACRDYLFDFEDVNKAVDYLLADVEGDKQVRRIAVSVTASDEPYTMNQIGLRTYRIQIVHYGEVGVGGEGFRRMRRENRKIRGLIAALGTQLGPDRVVDRITSNTPISINRLNLADDVSSILVGTTEYAAERVNPDF